MSLGHQVTPRCFKFSALPDSLGATVVKAPFVSPERGKTFVEQWPVKGPFLASQFNSGYNENGQIAHPLKELDDYFQKEEYPSGLLRQFGWSPRCTEFSWVLVKTNSE
jgi:hypothetical protein